jgi:hypothetical protein
LKRTIGNEGFLHAQREKLGISTATTLQVNQQCQGLQNVLSAATAYYRSARICGYECISEVLTGAQAEDSFAEDAVAFSAARGRQQQNEG